MRVIVIGSGPSGTAASLALLELGHSVVMVDSGHDISAETAVTLQKFHNKKLNDWSVSDYEWLHGVDSIVGSNKSAHEKLLFSEEFPYCKDKVFFNIKSDFLQYPSKSLGGFSRVWGAACMRFHKSDFNGWPITYDDLLPHYIAMEKVIPITGSIDNLYTDFPSYKINKRDLTDQSKSIVNKLNSHQRVLEGFGIKYGQSRLAIRDGCNYCGQCLFGCVYGQIFSTLDLIPILKANSKFEYIKINATDFCEYKNSVRLTCVDSNNNYKTLLADKIFIGAGPLSTALLIMNSLGIRKKLILKDAQSYVIPYIGKVPSEIKSKNSLSQLFIELTDQSLDNHNIHIQLYTWNDYIKKKLTEKLHISNKSFLNNFIDILFGKMIILQGYLPSYISGYSELSLGHKNGMHSLFVEHQYKNYYETKNYFKNIKKLIQPLAKSCDIYELPLLSSLNKVGSGYHSGGTFPMKVRPNLYETDLNGLLYGMNNVHLIDSSIFPEIPSSTITLTIMANAHRIATNIGKNFHE